MSNWWASADPRRSAGKSFATGEACWRVAASGWPPEEGKLWTTLAMAQYRSGDRGEAVVAAEKSIALSEGGTAADHLILTMARWQLGQQDEARQSYDRAVEWMEKNEPDDEQLSRVRPEAAEMLKDEGGRMKDEEE